MSRTQRERHVTPFVSGHAGLRFAASLTIETEPSRIDRRLGVTSRRVELVATLDASTRTIVRWESVDPVDGPYRALALHDSTVIAAYYASGMRCVHDDGSVRWTRKDLRKTQAMDAVVHREAVAVAVWRERAGPVLLHAGTGKNYVQVPSREPPHRPTQDGSDRNLRAVLAAQSWGVEVGELGTDVLIAGGVVWWRGAATPDRWAWADSLAAVASLPPPLAS